MSKLMRKLCVVLLSCSGSAALLGCAQPSAIKSVVDLPLKDTDVPGTSWQLAPMRAHAQYVLHGAISGKERRKRLGDYYFVDWYDGEPEKPVRLEMLYTQARTVSKVLSVSESMDQPRRRAGIRKTKFTFNGVDRAKKGDVLSWRINLYVDGKLVDSRRSFLWKDAAEQTH